MCGIVGIIANNGNVVTDIYDALISIQHRGQDAAGIITFDDAFHLKKGSGLVQDVFTEKNIARLAGRRGLGHVRYPTVGPGTGEDAQPFYLTAPFGIAMVHNGNVVNYHDLRKELEKKDHRLLSSMCDVEVILNIFAEELSKQNLDNVGPDEIFKAVEGVYRRIHGAYSVIAYIAGKGLLAFRDPWGIKPLVYACTTKNGRKACGFFSETVAIDIVGFTEGQQDVGAGEAVFIDEDLTVHKKAIMPKEHSPCMFEWIYFARPDSFIDEISVYRTRRRLGRELARVWEKTKLKADVVIPVPDSARSAALSFSQETGIPYREGFVKNRYVGRTFIMANQAKRQASIRYKLNTIRLEFEGKRVLIIDDSIVRGNTSAAIIKAARAAGARKVYFASYSAPLKFPCVYGIDMSTKDDFIALNRTEDEIAKTIGADKLIYQTVDGMIRSAIAGNKKITNFCLACFTGKYPTGDITPFLESIENDRRCACADTLED